MCGIAGVIDPKPAQSAGKLGSVVEKMADAVKNRGPDDSGLWVDEINGLAFGHRRLSIIDISEQGHQPMVSSSGNYVIAYNGEIYNFQKIKKDMEKEKPVKWKGHSDTEVLLEAIERYGVTGAVKLLNGMFAFAVWDQKQKSVTFVRDRLGKKPLYYGYNNGVFLFGSELKSFFAYPGFKGEIDRGSLALFLRHNYIPAPHSIYKGIRKLRPAHIVTIRLPLTPGQLPEPAPYWSAREVYSAGAQNAFKATEDELTLKLNDLLLDAVGMRMISDVPLGAFLSGGIDSSLVVSLMQAQSARKVKTFSIGFDEAAYNEAPFASEVARHLGTDHTELYVTPLETRDVIPGLPEIYDEPFADSSQIPTYLVSKMAREHVTVCLSGDGGDESFGGYNRYLWAMSIWRKIGWAPLSLRKLTAGAITSIPPGAWGKLYSAASPVLPDSVKVTNPGDKAHKLAELLTLNGPIEMYRWLVSQFREPERIVIGSKEPRTILSNEEEWASVEDFTQQMMFLDTVTYLPDDILTKVDRASMSVSLEARAPLLDYRVVEFAARLPVNMKIGDGYSKRLLRKALFKYVPRQLIERPKMGFGAPIDSWLRGPLREWAESLLDEKRLKRESIFDPAEIRKKWSEHLSGKRNWQYHLWTVLMFQAWYEKYHG
ncbi:Asparagine synthetase [glutamine-hydrolyzing] [hydrothermal vent metagenome]|uniref:Asparagine synthetase [glutamine-hydrolyzing] n=1 Tax=hydrothermal vent metagenome TaxID=652676 RepID=A0A3B1CG26_9ZZZZ